MDNFKFTRHNLALLMEKLLHQAEPLTHRRATIDYYVIEFVKETTKPEIM
jgi:hypothetical protein